jgi:hypothetical protein
MKQLTLVEWVRKYKIGESNEDCRECDECECGSEECFKGDYMGEEDTMCPIMEFDIKPEYEAIKKEELKKLRVIQKARLKP